MDALTLGIQFVLTIFIFLGLGYYIDTKVDTFPLFLSLFLFIGFGVALYTLIKSTKQNNKDDS